MRMRHLLFECRNLSPIQTHCGDALGSVIVLPAKSAAKHSHGKDVLADGCFSADPRRAGIEPLDDEAEGGA